jgi:hypothetical protein
LKKTGKEKMAQLHALLAVEDKLKTTAKNLIAEAIRTLGKEQLFRGHTKTLRMFAEGDDNRALERDGSEQVELTTTVGDTIDYIVGPVADYWDAVYQKDATNCVAKADIIIDGVTLVKDVPATFLLGLEAKLRDFRNVMNAIHTLPPGIRWEKAEDIKEGVWRSSRDVTTMKTAKEATFNVVVEATEHHPAQYERIDRMLNVGEYTTSTTSGLLTPADKADVLRRLDKLIEAVVVARSTANSTQTVNGKLARGLLDYVMTGAK